MSPFLPYSFWCCCLVTATCPSHFVFTRPEIKASQDGHRIDSRQKRAVTLAYARQRSERPLSHTPTRGSSRMCKPKSFDEIVQRPPDSVWCCEENSDTLVYHTNNGEGPKHAYDIRAAHANILIQKLTCGKSQMQNDQLMRMLYMLSVRCACVRPPVVCVLEKHADCSQTNYL